MIVIKSTSFCGIRFLDLIYSEDSKTYEAQYSNKDDIIQTEGEYTTLKDGLKAYTAFKKRLIKVEQ